MAEHPVDAASKNSRMRVMILLMVSCALMAYHLRASLVRLEKISGVMDHSPEWRVMPSLAKAFLTSSRSATMVLMVFARS